MSPSIDNELISSRGVMWFILQIVEVDYCQLSVGDYSSLVGGVVERCLTADPERRPDAVELGALISSVLMQRMDQLSLSILALQAKLNREKQRTIK